MDSVLSSAAGIFSLGTAQRKTRLLQRRQKITRGQLQQRRFWRDKHNSRRFVDEKETEIRAVGAASIYLAGFTSVALFQLALPLTIPEAYVAIYAATGALTVSIFTYAVILHIYLLVSMYASAHRLRRDVEIEREAYMDALMLDEVEDLGQVTEDKNGELVVVDEYTLRHISHREEHELKRTWALGPRSSPAHDVVHDKDAADAPPTTMGDDFLSVFMAFKCGTAVFVLLVIELVWMQAYEHHAHLPYALVCFIICIAFIVVFLRGTYWEIAAQLEASYSPHTYI